MCNSTQKRARRVSFIVDGYVAIKTGEELDSICKGISEHVQGAFVMPPDVSLDSGDMEGLLNAPQAGVAPTKTALFLNNGGEALIEMDMFRLHEGMLCFYLHEKLLAAINPQTISYFGPAEIRMNKPAESTEPTERVRVW